jgi:hypothetical protein
MTMEWFGVTDLAARIRLSLLLPRRVALGEGELPDRYVIRGSLAGYSKAQVYRMPAPLLSLIFLDGFVIRVATSTGVPSSISIKP